MVVDRYEVASTDAPSRNWSKSCLLVIYIRQPSSVVNLLLYVHVSVIRPGCAIIK